MKKTIFIKIISVLSICVLFMGLPNAAGMLGVSTHAASKIVDAIFAGMSIWTIAGLIIASGGAAGVAMLIVKKGVQTLGRKAAITW